MTPAWQELLRAILTFIFGWVLIVAVPYGIVVKYGADGGKAARVCYAIFILLYLAYIYFWSPYRHDVQEFGSPHPLGLYGLIAAWVLCMVVLIGTYKR